MKNRKIIKNENGGALVFVVLFVVLGIFGFTSLVIDVGFLYNTRKEMVTAADAAALAGAMEMEKSLGITESGSLSTIKANSIAIAKNIASLNGAEGETIVEIKAMDIELTSGGIDEDRAVISVTTHKNEKLIFARLLGLDYADIDVTSTAVATWGNTQKVTGGQILPLFMEESEYELGIDSLHGDNTVINGITYPSNWDLAYLNETMNFADVKDVFNGANSDDTYVLNEFLVSAPGNKAKVIDEIETRMIKAALLDTKEERKQFMSGLIPIVEVIDVGTPHLQLRIKYFAVYIIEDVIRKDDLLGSIYALKGDDYLPNFTSIKYVTENYPSLTIVGHFTKEIIELYEVITEDDQVSLPDYPGLSTYSKLVK